MENRKNTILLTVIAVATLLVAVVGATFAYFTAQAGGISTADIEVVTRTTSSSVINVGGPLSLTADQDNFSSTAATHLSSNTVSGTVAWTSSTGAGAGELSFCYTVQLSVDTNTFEYLTSQNDANSVGDTYYSTAELVLNVTKNGNPITDSTGAVGTLNYTTVSSDLTGSTRGEVSGWDITTATSTYSITVGTDAVHTITVDSAGDSGTDTWAAYITLINKDIDQEYNTGKSFTGRLEFTQASCS